MILRMLYLLGALSLPLPSEASSLRLPGSIEPSTYVCPPCPHVADLLHAQPHSAPGTCPVCGMKLVERPSPIDDAHPQLSAGSGAFSLSVGPGGTREVAVYYYRPRKLQENARVLIVLPGAGRNAWDYRDHWIDAAERYGVLVLSPHYPESRYPRFWNYNLAGMIAEVEIDRNASALADYRIVTDREQWLFDDIDDIFGHSVRAAGLRARRYDLFGHSAGGQFLHRFAMFADSSTRADRILASNSGWYTVPDAEARFPYGLAEAPIQPRQLAEAFTRRLVVFLGGSDDANEQRGDLVHGPDPDRQGLHRLARGKYFHEKSMQTSQRMGMASNWSLVVVPGVGHDPKGMAKAAATYLYGDLVETRAPGSGRDAGAAGD